LGAVAQRSSRAQKLKGLLVGASLSQGKAKKDFYSNGRPPFADEKLYFARLPPLNYMRKFSHISLWLAITHHSKCMI
jgi:hypothetical protein